MPRSPTPIAGELSSEGEAQCDLRISLGEAVGGGGWGKKPDFISIMESRR